MAESRPLGGITVVDLTRVLAGPFCTMILRDLGADVIKVEPPTGDEARGFGPFLPDAPGSAGGASAYFTSLNCGKRSVVLDLRQEVGRAALAELIRRADVLVENFRPGTLARLGFPPERLEALNSRLVYAAISGFGATGPAAGRAAYDLIIQALSGLMSITGTEPGLPHDVADGGAVGDVPAPGAHAAAPSAGETSASAGGPRTQPGRRVRVGTSIADIVSGLYAAVGVVAALVRRAHSGRGAVLDLAMLDATVSVLENAIARYQVTGTVPAPLGSRHPSITPFETYATADQEIVVAAGNDRLFATLCATVGRGELATDARFATNAARNEHVAALKRELETALVRQPGAVWLQRLAAAGVPAAAVNTVADLFDDPQIAAREMLVPVAGAAGLLMPGSPLKFADAAPERERPPAPALGEHTDQVLAELGLRHAAGNGAGETPPPGPPGSAQ